MSNIEEKSFSEWVKRQQTIGGGAGDRYEALPDISKKVIDTAIEKYIEWLLNDEWIKKLKKLPDLNVDEAAGKLSADEMLKKYDVNIDRWPDTKSLIISAMEEYKTQPVSPASINVEQEEIRQIKAVIIHFATLDKMPTLELLDREHLIAHVVTIAKNILQQYPPKTQSQAQPQSSINVDEDLNEAEIEISTMWCEVIHAISEADKKGIEVGEFIPTFLEKNYNISRKVARVNVDEAAEKLAIAFAEWMELQSYHIKGMDDTQRQTVYKRFREWQSLNI